MIKYDTERLIVSEEKGILIGQEKEHTVLKDDELVLIQKIGKGKALDKSVSDAFDKVEAEKVIIDPVLSKSLDGISTSLKFLGHPVSFHYAVKTGNFSPRSIAVNGNDISFFYDENKYRAGGAAIPKGEFLSLLNKRKNVVEVRL